MAAAPCTAMVFVWSYLTDDDGPYTLAQVAINDLIMIFAFAPIVMFLVGVTGVHIPSEVLFTSVVVFIVIPLIAGFLSRTVFTAIETADVALMQDDLSKVAEAIHLGRRTVS